MTPSLDAASPSILLHRLVMLGVLLSGALGALGGCSEEDALAPCVAGKACICQGEACALTCGGNGAGCAMECSQGADCSLTCPGGNCSLECDGAASCQMNCPGGGCALECSDTNTCVTKGCSAGCATSCGGAATCESSCGLAQGCGTS